MPDTRGFSPAKCVLYARVLSGACVSGIFPQGPQPARLLRSKPLGFRRDLGYGGSGKRPPQPRENRRFANIAWGAVQQGEADPLRPANRLVPTPPRQPSEPRIRACEG